MAEKRRGRWVHDFVSPTDPAWVSSGVELLLTRQGLHLSGWYDSMVGIEERFITWDEFDSARERVMKGRP
jgi:hypothetical protein